MIMPIKIFRCLYRRCLPLPIPNRAVKPARADGIAVTGGRVGRCLFLHGSPCWKQSRASFVWILFPVVDEHCPSAAVAQLSLSSVVWSILVAKGNCNPVDSNPTAFTDRVKPYCFSRVSYSRISVSTARTTRNYWGNILSCYYPYQAILFFICIVLLYINGLAVATCNKQLYMLSDCWEVYR